MGALRWVGFLFLIPQLPGPKNAMSISPSAFSFPKERSGAPPVPVESGGILRETTQFPKTRAMVTRIQGIQASITR